MSYLNMARQWKGRAISGEVFTVYPVRTIGLDPETLKDLGIPEDDEWTWLYQPDIDDLCCQCSKAWDSVDWASGELDEEYQEDVLHSLIRPADWYLVYASGVTWDGRSGYRFEKAISHALYRSYDATITADAVSRNGKTLRCRESSHDVPMGSFTWIIALTDRENDLLQNSSFEQIRRFVMRHADTVKD